MKQLYWCSRRARAGGDPISCSSSAGCNFFAWYWQGTERGDICGWGLWGAALLREVLAVWDSSSDAVDEERLVSKWIQELLSYRWTGTMDWTLSERAALAICLQHGSAHVAAKSVFSRAGAMSWISDKRMVTAVLRDSWGVKSSLPSTRAKPPPGPLAGASMGWGGTRWPCTQEQISSCISSLIT